MAGGQQLGIIKVLERSDQGPERKIMQRQTPAAAGFAEGRHTSATGKY